MANDEPQGNDKRAGADAAEVQAAALAARVAIGVRDQ